jgi:arylsulfatase A-like enzyme
MNIILLISDTYRYDNIYGPGDMPVSTPCLDAFAQRAVSLSRLYTGSFPTIPHRTDLTTGRIGWPWYGWQELALSSHNALPRMLEAQGYVTQLLCDCPHLFKSGFQNTFCAAEVRRGQEGDMPFLRMNHEIVETTPRNKTREGNHFKGHTLPELHCWANRNWRLEEDRFCARTARRAVEWLEENYQYDPFFLWVDFFDPHEPWDPPEYMVRKYDPDYNGPPMLHPNYGRADDYTPAELRNLRAHYCAEAELVDRWVGRVLQKIDDLDLWRNSIVIFTTDHGISVGEHNRTGKSNINSRDDRFWPIYPEVAHIPLLVAAPGLQGGSVVDALLQPADIALTIAGLAGVDLAPPEPLHGTSFAPLLRGDNSAARRDCVISATHPRITDGAFAPGSVTPALYTERWCYVPVGAEGTPELYDLTCDPFGETNIAGDNADTVKELQAMFNAQLQAMDAPENIRTAIAQK